VSSRLVNLCDAVSSDADAHCKTTNCTGRCWSTDRIAPSPLRGGEAILQDGAVSRGSDADLLESAPGLVGTDVSRENAISWADSATLPHTA
jgi:hypothetical protein